MVDSGASSNVMPLSVCQKINVEVKPSDLKIIQLDRTNVTVVGELKDVLIRLSSNPKVHQVIDIVVVDIPEVYGMFLSRDWSEQLHGYFLQIGLICGYQKTTSQTSSELIGNVI
jgi:hypothetical protein